MHHELKIMPVFYDAVKAGDKTFEIRYNDRDFRRGDTATLKKYEAGKYYPDPDIEIIITYITPYKQREGWVVFGFLKKEQDHERKG